MSEDTNFVPAKDVKVEELRSKGFDFVEDEYEKDHEAYNDRFLTVRGSQKDLYQQYADTFINPYPEVPCPPEALEKVKKKTYDIPYGEHERQRFDIYYPEDGEGPFPVVINLHAGGFTGGDRRDFSLPPMFKVLEKGYALVSMGYRICNIARFPAPIYDVKGGVRYLRAHAAELNIDPDKIVSWGYSAGAYLAAALGVTGDEKLYNDTSLGNLEYSSRVNVVIENSGHVGNWLAMDDFLGKLAERTGIPMLFAHCDPNSPESMFFGAPLPKIPELVRLADLNVYVTKDTVPTMIVHGTDDPIIPFELAKKYHETLVSVIGEDNTSMLVLEGAHHCDDPAFMTDETFSKEFEFIEKHLK